MLNLCFIAAMTASMISNAPADRKPTVIDESAALMPAVGMPPPPGTRMLGMSITPDNPDAPVIYRVGSALSADDFPEGLCHGGGGRRAACFASTRKSHYRNAENR